MYIIIINKNWNDLRNIDPAFVKEEDNVIYENEENNTWHNGNDKIISVLFGTFFSFVTIFI